VRIILDIALTHLRSRTRQTLVSLIGVTLGVGFSVATAAMLEGGQVDFERQIIDATPHIRITDEYRDPQLQPVERRFADGAVALRGLKPEEELRGIKNAHATLVRLRELPGAAVAPSLRGQVVIRHGGTDAGVNLVGTDPDAERLVSDLAGDMREGRLENLYTTANGLILGIGLARQIGARLGSSLQVTSPTGQSRLMKVVGIFRTGVTAIDDGEAYTLLKTAQILQERPNVVNEIRIRLADAFTARAVARRVEAMVGYKSQSWQEANEDVLEIFFVRNIIMFTIVAGILVVAGFGIFNIISTITFEKARDIAILKSLGFEERDIRAIFLSEGLAIGVIGALLGWVLGYVLTRIVGSIPLEVDFYTEITQIPVLISPAHYALAAAFALVSSGLAGYLPACKAARQNPVDIIRGAA